MSQIISICFVIFIVQSAALAKKASKVNPELLPAFYNIGAEDQKSSLSMECKGKPPYSDITCDFIQIRVGKPSDDKINSRLAVIEKENTDPKDLKDFCSHAKEFAAKLMTDEAVPERALAMQDDSTDLNEACNCKDAKCLKAHFKKVAVESTKICEVAPWTFTTKFKRKSPTKWVSVDDGFMCDFITIQTIERQGEVWSYSMVRSGSQKEKVWPCDAAELNKPRKFSSKYGTKFKMDCSTVVFTPF